MYQMVFNCIITNQVILFIIHPYFRQLLGGLKIQLVVIQLSFNLLIHLNKHQIVAHLFMHLMEQLTLHLLILLIQEYSHFHLMLHFGMDIWLMKLNSVVLLLILEYQKQFYHQFLIFIPVVKIQFKAKVIHQT